MPAGNAISKWAKTTWKQLTNGTFAFQVQQVDDDGVLVSGGGGGSTQYDRDTGAGAADKLTMAGAVRSDAGGTLVSADGDRTPLSIDGNGALRVTGGGGGTEYTEDDPASTNPAGNASILVRKDTPASEVSADGDNVAQRGTTYGAAYVTLLDTAGSPVAVGGGTQYTEDAAAAANPIGTALILVRRDTLSSSEVSADGDNVAAKGTSKGELHVRDADGAAESTLSAISGDLGADTDAEVASGNASLIAIAKRLRTLMTASSAHHLITAATDNAANIKASAGTVFGVHVYNNADYPVYVKLHNNAGVPTAGAGVVRTIGVQAGTQRDVSFKNGLAFATGIAITVVKDIADAGTTAVALSDAAIEVEYA